MNHAIDRCRGCGARLVNDEAVLGPGAVTKIFGVSRRTISDWVRRGKLPSINPGGVVRIPARAVEQQLAGEPHVLETRVS
jgi:excisionase family DNA binding protein